jgi:DnaJ-class molecular chaperone
MRKKEGFEIEASALNSFKEAHPNAKQESHFEVCGTCEGSGTALVGPFRGMAFTSSEMADMGEDFEEDYFGGRFDGPCPQCQGLRVQQVTAFTDGAVQAEWEEYLNEWYQSEADDYAVYRAETGYQE